MVERKVSIVDGKLHIIGGRKGRSRVTDRTLSPGALLIFKPLSQCQINLGTVKTNQTNQPKHLQIYGLRTGDGERLLPG